MSDILLAGSVLGERAETYTEQEKIWIHMIAVRLRDRERTHNMEREDMGLYVRAAGLVYELAKKLNEASAQSRFARKTMDQWLRVVTGINFSFVTEEHQGLPWSNTFEAGSETTHGKETKAIREEKKEEREDSLDVEATEGVSGED